MKNDITENKIVSENSENENKTINDIASILIKTSCGKLNLPQSSPARQEIA